MTLIRSLGESMSDEMDDLPELDALMRAEKKHDWMSEPRFKRMFDYYLLVCAGSFRSRENHLWQLVLSAGGLDGGYRPPRWSPID